jgi:hypothetical protein
LGAFAPHPHPQVTPMLFLTKHHAINTYGGLLPSALDEIDDKLHTATYRAIPIAAFAPMSLQMPVRSQLQSSVAPSY